MCGTGLIDVVFSIDGIEINQIHPGRPRMKTSFIRVWLLISVQLFAACRATTRQSANTEQHLNPLLSPSPLPFQAPPFDRIHDGDFAPAFDAGMKEHLADVDEIANNPAPPTFENTLVALEKTGQTLTRVSLIFNALASANTNDQLQKLQEEEAPKLAAHQDAINLNPKLFARIETLFNQRNTLQLDPESNRLLEYQYQQFVMAGARLSDEDKSKLKKLNEEDAALSAKFSNQLLAAAKDGALVVHDKSELEGVSQADLDAAAEAAKSRKLEGSWVLALQNTTQ